MPKTYSELWNEIISYENLHKAYLAARKGKRYQQDVLDFGEKLEESLINIQNHLIWKSWRPGRYKSFITHEPKKRYIQAPPFKDRVVHHALVRVVNGLFERKFIYDSYACRSGKGTYGGVLQAQGFLKKAKTKWGHVYVLKADISKYFPSIRHDRLLQIIKRTIRDPDALWLCETIINSCGENRRGIPVGALTSQLFANIYLDQLDHLIKDRLGVRFYVRYMDDWIILAPGKKELWDILGLTADFLDSRLGLALNPKTEIFPASQGVDFCGYRIWATHMLPRKRNVRRMKKRLNKLKKRYEEGGASLDEVRAVVMSFLGYMKHCNGYDTTRYILASLVLIKKSNAAEKSAAIALQKTKPKFLD